MNYISHYFLDAEKDNPYFNFGLILPDMMGAAHRGWKPFPFKSENAPDEHIELARGVAAHLTADKLFHNTHFFKSGCQYLRDLFEQHGLAIPGIRMFFLVHVYLEMMLDRIIIRKHPEAAQQFYADIDQTEENIILDFIRSDGITKAEKFPLFFNRFREHKYLLSYTKNDNLFFAINRTLNRAGQPAFPDEKYAAFSRATDIAEQFFTPQAFPFFAGIGEKN